MVSYKMKTSSPVRAQDVAVPAVKQDGVAFLWHTMARAVSLLSAPVVWKQLLARSRYHLELQVMPLPLSLLSLPIWLLQPQF